MSRRIWVTVEVKEYTRVPYENLNPEDLIELVSEANADAIVGWEDPDYQDYQELPSV